jgi:hypothetical protein
MQNSKSNHAANNGPARAGAAIPARVKFAYADIGCGSRNLVLGCDLTRAICAEINWVRNHKITSLVTSAA